MTDGSAIEKSRSNAAVETRHAFSDFWQVEAACRDAWPARKERAIGAWLFRHSGGTTRRTNSLNPIAANPHDPLSMLDAARDFYAPRATPPLFRVPSFLPETATRLERHGYRPEGQTATIGCDLGPTAHRMDPAVELHSAPNAAWIEAKRRLTPSGASQQRAFEDMLSRIAAPARFASLSVDGRPRCVAYGVIAHGILVLEAVVTAPEDRRRGLSRRVVASLMAWAREAGTERACLQVVADNLPARRLYRRVGFDQELYRYAYYRAGGPARPD